MSFTKKKKYGQNFLTSDKFPLRIANESGITKEDGVEEEIESEMDSEDNSQSSSSSSSSSDVEDSESMEEESEENGEEGEPVPVIEMVFLLASFSSLEIRHGAPGDGRHDQVR